MSDDQQQTAFAADPPQDAEKEAFKADGLEAVRAATADRLSHANMSFADFERGVEALLHHIVHWRPSWRAPQEDGGEAASAGSAAAAAGQAADQSGAAKDDSHSGQSAAPVASGGYARSEDGRLATMDRQAQDIQAQKPPESASDG